MIMIPRLMIREWFIEPMHGFVQADHCKEFSAIYWQVHNLNVLRLATFDIQNGQRTSHITLFPYWCSFENNKAAILADKEYLKALYGVSKVDVLQSKAQERVHAFTVCLTMAVTSVILRVSPYELRNLALSVMHPPDFVLMCCQVLALVVLTVFSLPFLYPSPGQLKLWMNLPCIVQHLVPLRSSVIRWVARHCYVFSELGLL